MVGHYFHNTGGSFYPLSVSFHLLFLVTSLLFIFNYSVFFLLIGATLSLLILCIVWGNDVYLEGLSGSHNVFVQDGLKFSFMLFLFSEFMFFVSIFWVFFDSSFSTVVETGVLWPPLGLITPNTFGLPFLGTCLLLSSGVTITWCHCNLLSNSSANGSLIITICLAMSFVFLQYLEYTMAFFTVGDSIYGTIFYFSTGFHGLHVIFGTLFLLYGLWRLVSGHFTIYHHLGLECSILYWHFVDVVWLFLYIFVYWWGFWQVV